MSHQLQRIMGTRWTELAPTAWGGLWITLWGSGALAQPLVVLDAGHGGTDPGAVGCQREEATHVLDVTQRIKPLLESAGLRAELTRSSDSYVELRARAEFANQRQASAFVSVHANANEGTAASGTETWIANAASGASVTLAELLQAELVSAWGLRDRGVKRANFTVLTASNMPAALTEIGFINNCSQDSELIGDPEQRQEIARAHALAIAEYLEAGDVGNPGGAEGPMELPGTLIGVTFEDSGEGLNDPSMRLPGVEVSVEPLGLSMRSAPNTGAWSFDVPPGLYTVSASLNAYEDEERSCEVFAGRDAWCSLGLRRSSGGQPQAGGEPMMGGEPTPGGQSAELDQGPPDEDMDPMAGVAGGGGLEAGSEPVGAGVMSGGDEAPPVGLPVEGGSEGGAEASPMKRKAKDSGCQASSSGGERLILALLALIAMGLSRSRRARSAVKALSLIGGISLSLSAHEARAHVPNVSVDGELAVLGEGQLGALELGPRRLLAEGPYAKVILSPRGDQALLVGLDYASISLLSLDEGSSHPLTKLKGAGRNPSWLPDGSGVALHSPEQPSNAVPMIYLDLKGHSLAPPLASPSSALRVEGGTVTLDELKISPPHDHFFMARVSSQGAYVVMWGLSTGLWLYRAADRSLMTLGTGGHPSFSLGGRYLVFEKSADEGGALRGAELFYADLAQAAPQVIALTQSADHMELAPSVAGGHLAYVDSRGRVWLTELRSSIKHHDCPSETRDKSRARP